MNYNWFIDREWSDLRINMNNKWYVFQDVRYEEVVSRMMNDIYE